MDKKYKQIVVNSLLTDIIQSFMRGDTLSSSNKLNESITELSQRLDLDEKESKSFLNKSFKHIDNLGLIISYLVEQGKEGVMYKVEQEALKLMNFIHSLTDFPFITEYGFNDKRGYNVMKMISFLENLVESYMLVDY